MTEWNVFLVFVSIIGFSGTMYSMFYKPTHELKLEIVKLNGTLEGIRKNDDKQDKRLDEHNGKLDNHEHRITVLENTKFIKSRDN